MVRKRRGVAGAHAGGIVAAVLQALLLLLLTLLLFLCSQRGHTSSRLAHSKVARADCNVARAAQHVAGAADGFRLRGVLRPVCGKVWAQLELTVLQGVQVRAVKVLLSLRERKGAAGHAVAARTQRQLHMGGLRRHDPVNGVVLGVCLAGVALAVRALLRLLLLVA